MTRSKKRKEGPGKLGISPVKRTKMADAAAKSRDSSLVAEKPKEKTFRLSNIPIAMSRNSLKEWLEKLEVSCVPAPSENVVQISMAPTCEDFSQATVTFKVSPAQLANLGDTDTLQYPGNDKILFDRHFEGWTVLHDPREASKKRAAAEYVRLSRNAVVTLRF